MNACNADKVFDGSIPQLYETYLTPLIFESYARDLARRVNAASPSQVLEVAAGTGVVTRAMVHSLGNNVSIVATDLNQPMLDHAAQILPAECVTWRQADAHSLPFDDQSFDVVVCQFAVMFFADRAKAYAEVHRVLKPGGLFVFNVWDKIEENEFADTITNALAHVFLEDPPRFLARTPHGYSNAEEITSDLERAGFTAKPDIEMQTQRSRATGPSIPAIAYCQGTPLRNEIESRDASKLMYATKVATEALAKRFGTGAVDSKIQAYVISVRA